MRTIIALAVLLIGGAASFWIIAPQSPKAAHAVVSFSDKNPGADPRFQIEPDPVRGAANNGESDISEENVIRNYSEEVARLNPQGQGQNGAVKVPNEAAFSQMIQDEIGKPIPVRTYEEKDIVVLNATDKKSVIAYATAIDAASKKTIGKLAIGFAPAIAQFVTQDDTQALSLHASATAAYITALLATPVPSSWKQFHLTLINLLQKRLAYTNAILDNNGSQLKIAAAVNNITALLDEEQQLIAMINDAP